MTLLNDILDLEVPAGLRISPGGTKVVYYTKAKCDADDGRPRRATIWVADVGQAKSARKVTDGTWCDRQPRWDPNGRSIVFLSDRVVRGRSHKMYRLAIEDGADYERLSPEQRVDPEYRLPNFSYQPRGHIARVSSKTSGKIIKKLEFSPDGRRLGYVAMPARDHGPPQTFAQGPRGDRSSHADFHTTFGGLRTIRAWSGHVADFAWMADSSRVLLLVHRTPDIESADMHGTEFWIFNVHSDKARTLLYRMPLRAWSPIWANERLHFLSWNVPGDATSGLAVYGLDVHIPARISRHRAFMFPNLVRNPTATCTKVVAGNTSCVVRLVPASRNHVLVHLQEGTREKLRFLPSKRTLLVQQTAILDAAARKGKAKGSTIVATVQGDLNHPSEVFSLKTGDIDSGGEAASVQLSDLGTAFSAKHGAAFGTASFLECPSSDGQAAIDALLLTPAATGATDTSSSSEPYPTVVLLHDGPWNWAPLLVPLLLCAGIAVLQPNYRGSSGRGAQFASSAARGGLGRNDDADVVALVEAAVHGGHADPQRLLVTGWGAGGGHLAYLAAVRNGMHGHGWRYAGVVAGGGVCDWDAMVVSSDRGYAYAARLRRAPWYGEAGGSEAPSEEVTEAPTESPTTAIPPASTMPPPTTSTPTKASALWQFAAGRDRIPPMLIMHGEQDVHVPVSQAHGFRRAMEEAGLPLVFVTYPGQGHRIRRRVYVRDAASQVIRFACQHLRLEPDLEPIIG